MIHTITAFNHSKTKVLGSLTFNYHREGIIQHVAKIDVKGSDGRQASLSMAYLDITESGEHLKNIVSAFQPGKPPLYYGHDIARKMPDYQKKRLKRVEGPGGRKLVTEFDKHTGKVSAQFAPVGPSGELCPIGRYYFVENCTHVIDAEGNKITYQFDGNKRLSAILLYEKETLFRVDRFQWDYATGNLLTKTIESPDGTCVWKNTIRYDAHQNPVEESIGDGKQSYVIYRTFSTDGFNLKLSESDSFGRLIKYTYVPGTNLLATEFIYEGPLLRKRNFHFYDDCAVCIKSITDDGSSEQVNDLKHVTFRKIFEIQPRTEMPCLGLPACVMEKTVDAEGHEILLGKVVYAYTAFGKVLREDHYDSRNIFKYAVINAYDEKERFISSIDPEGNETFFQYDANHNLIAQRGPRKDVKKEWIYDLANRPIKETDEEGLSISKRYDKLGRLIAVIDYSGGETLFSYDALGRMLTKIHPDGAKETFTYDILGNITSETDPLGYTTTRTFNFQGKPTNISYPDGSQENFTYRTDGKLISHIDKNGAKKTFSYDVFGNVLLEETFSSEGFLLKTISRTFTPFVKLSETDPCGILTSYTYDFSGKKISETRGHSTTHFYYDTLGRLSKKQIGDSIHITEYDLLNQVIETRLTDTSGILLKKENYSYDALGNKIATITSKGVIETQYNSRKEPLFIKDPLGHLTVFSYDQKKRQKTVAFPNGVTKKTLYDCRGKEVESTTYNPKGAPIQRSTRQFDAVGNLLEHQEDVFEGTVHKKTIQVKKEYGPCHHLLSLTESELKKTSYLYDDKGRLQQTTKPDGTTHHYTYDSLGRLTHFISSDSHLSYLYDPCDRVLSIIDSIAHTSTNRIYDYWGRLSEEKLANGLCLKYAYDAQGRRSSLFLPDGSVAQYAYHGGFLHEVKWKKLVYTYVERDLEGTPL